MAQQVKSGESIFKMEVPYKLLDNGTGDSRPLIIYLHGYKQNIQYFEKKCSMLLSLNAYHLFIQGPYPIYDETRKRKVEQWGRAWYLYDGEQPQFIKSLEKTSQFIDNLILNIKDQLDITRLTVLGYSMGGYLAGYFALSRQKLINDLIVIGGRIKVEHFAGTSFNDLHILHLHGKKDQSVSSLSARKSCEQLGEQGADVSYKEIEAGHQLDERYFTEICKWMKRR